MSSSSPVNMQHLPDDLLLNCLARVSRLYYPTLSLVSKRLRSLLASTDLYETRRLLGRTESCPYVCFNHINSSTQRWFTLCRGTTSRIPRWSTSCFGPCRILTNRTRNLMVSVPSHNFTPNSRWNHAAIGSSIYMIGGSINHEPSSRVFVMDTRSHTWHEAPSIHVARKKPVMSVLDGKIYVVEGCQDCNDSNFMEFFDPKTQIWEHAPSPGAEIRARNIYTSFAKEGNLYLIGDKNMVYKPKENKWDSVRWSTIPRGALDFICMIDNLEYCYNRTLKWWDSKGRSWRALKGLKGLPKLPKGYVYIRLVNCGGKIVFFWKENNRSIGSSKKKMIWGAEIAIERRNEQEVFGKINWCDVVLTVPKSCYFEQLIVATL